MFLYCTQIRKGEGVREMLRERKRELGRERKLFLFPYTGRIERILNFPSLLMEPKRQRSKREIES
jgi:hypothetical protein